LERVYSVYNDKPGVNLAIIVFTTEPIHEDFTQRPDSMMNPVFDSWRRVLSRWGGGIEEQEGRREGGGERCLYRSDCRSPCSPLV